jgi:predicted metal-dependent hydrolase
MAVQTQYLEDLPVDIRESARARRMSLRVDPTSARLRVTVPPGTAARKISDFVGRHLEWARDRLDKVPDRVPLVAGRAVPVLGTPRTIVHDPAFGRRVVLGDADITVGGEAVFVPRRLGDWLKAEAKRQIEPLVRDKAARLGRVVGGITVRDTRSRWGSCASSGRLNFSWRLVLAPPAVLDYVVAHEVAHLAQMNHSPEFWVLCADLAEHGLAPRDWLRRHGAELWRYG